MCESRPAGTRRPLVVGIAGASGAILAQRAVQRLGEAKYPLVVVATEAAQRVWREELRRPFGEDAEVWARQFRTEVAGVRDIGHRIASGSFPTAGMLVIPCSMDTVSAIAVGRSSNLLERAADVTLKEGRRLVLVPRETPLSAIHLENMLKLARLGVRLVPPVPAFYLQPRGLEDIVASLVERILQVVGLPDLEMEPMAQYQPSGEVAE